jgi:hypothetical protein
MPVTYTIDGDARHVRVRYEGDPSFEEWAAVMTEVFARPEFRPPMSLLLDRRGAAVPGREYIRRTAEFAKRYRPQLATSRWAIVADSADMVARASMA